MTALDEANAAPLAEDVETVWSVIKLSTLLMVKALAAFILLILFIRGRATVPGLLAGLYFVDTLMAWLLTLPVAKRALESTWITHR